MYFFSLVMVFVPMGFSMTRFLTRHYVIQAWIIKGECYNIDDYPKDACLTSTPSCHKHVSLCL